MKIMKQVFFIIIFSVAFLQSSLAMGQFFFFQHPLQGKMAPDFGLKTLQGQTVRMSEYRAGQPSIIFFWATWCPHCRIQLKELYDKRDDFLQDGIKVMLVDLQESAQKVEAYLQRRGIDFEVFLDEDANVAEQYQIIGIPAFFFIDSNGKIVAVKNFLPENSRVFFKKEEESGFSFGESLKERVKDNE